MRLLHTLLSLKHGEVSQSTSLYFSYLKVTLCLQEARAKYFWCTPAFQGWISERDAACLQEHWLCWNHLGWEVLWERSLGPQLALCARGPHQDAIPGASLLPILQESKPSCHCPAQPSSSVASTEASQKWVTETTRHILALI